eukprot:Sspe_Gene.42053::Locus_20397_Transcript_1_2_Confidence_0.667_Length_1114::g.42053::m.42053
MEWFSQTLEGYGLKDPAEVTEYETRLRGNHRRFLEQMATWRKAAREDKRAAADVLGYIRSMDKVGLRFQSQFPLCRLPTTREKLGAAFCPKGDTSSCIDPVTELSPMLIFCSRRLRQDVAADPNLEAGSAVEYIGEDYWVRGKIGESKHLEIESVSSISSKDLPSHARPFCDWTEGKLGP